MHQRHHRVKKGVSAFWKSSAKSKFNVSDTFLQGGYNVKRNREKSLCSYALPFTYTYSIPYTVFPKTASPGNVKCLRF